MKPISAAERAGFSFLGVCLAFDNFPPLYAISGLSTGSPAIFILAVMLVFTRKLQSRPMRLFRWGMAVLAGFQVLSILSALALDPKLIDESFLGEPTILKGLRTLIIVALWVVTIFIGARLAAARKERLFYIGMGLLGANVVAVALQVSGISSASAVDWAHAVTWFENRPRGFKFESSALGASFLAAGALIFIGRKLKRVSGVVVVLVCLCGSIVSTSRGALTAVAGATLLVGLALLVRPLSNRIAWWSWGIILALLFATIAVAGISLTISPIWGQFASGQSDATRGGWGLVALEAIKAPPLGLNLLTYWNQVTPMIAETTSSLSQWFSFQDLREFRILSEGGTDSGLTPKTLPALMAVWFGWPGMILSVSLMAWVVVRSCRWEKASPSGSVLIAATMLGLAIYVPGIFIYETALVVGAALGARIHRGKTVEWEDPR